MRAITTASSAPATARNTTLPAASARGQRRPTWRCRPINSFPILKSRSAKAPDPGSETLQARNLTSHRVVYLPQDRINERTIRFPADQSRLEVDRTASPDHGPHAFIVRGVSDAAQPELLVDLRRYPFDHAGPADPDRRDPGDALHAGSHHGFQIGRRDRP